ncbi:uncharacterized protein KY384_004571 [Bacidia gigantensis]|uniref:uncharacterized protein n=1 Tax=Bacidia gigantensis TaxID=2732470 RepID=UPI001D052543|nr:uncharacterized protein KY384_004571 [Bacidia gigantensis]KAG8531213.1 hypothetical protein KY384_004571 [Bacidia gigantensis]
MPKTIEITQTITIKDIDSEPTIQTKVETSKPTLNMAPSPFVPSSISAVESNQLSILYYARPDGDIAALTAQKSGEDPSNADYKSTNVILEGNTISATVPQLSAVAYDFHGSKEIRLYYIGGKLGAPTLRELVRSNGGEWKDGALNKLRLPITPNSLISANVEDDVGDLKVFYNSTDDDDNTVPTVAWVTKGQTAWSSRIIGKWK